MRLLAARFGVSAVVVLAGLMFTVSGSAGAAVATPLTPLISTATSDSGGGTVGDGTVLNVTFNKAPVLAGSYSLMLTDGSTVDTLSSAAGTVSASVSGTGIAFTVHGATSLSLSLLEILASTGVTDASGSPWDLVASGRVDKSDLLAAPTCASVAGYTRVFGGSNCAIGFGQSGPTAPDVLDVIPLPTQDLPGPPDDNAPEVITNCQVGASDIVFDVNTGAQLGANACGNNPQEQLIGNSNSNTLDYIPTPGLVSFQEIGVVETIPGSTYVSATSVPPQLSAITVSGDRATFTYFGNVVCQSTSTDGPTISQFTYVTPYTKTTLSPGDLVYPSAISCPPVGGGASVTLTYPGPIPLSAGLRFKFEGYGPGHFIVGAPGSAFANEREASESAYAGPTATVDSFKPHSRTLPSSAGGSVTVAFATTAATTCSISAVSLPAGAAALTLPSVASCNGAGAIGVPANPSSARNVVYRVTLTALGVHGAPAASREITITVPARGRRPKAPNTRVVFARINSRSDSATFRFAATGKSTGFRCALVRKRTRKGAKTPSPKYSVCGASKTFKHLKAGSFVMYVRATGPGGGDKSPATYRFKIT